MLIITLMLPPYHASVFARLRCCRFDITPYALLISISLRRQLRFAACHYISFARQAASLFFAACYDTSRQGAFCHCYERLAGPNIYVLRCCLALDAAACCQRAMPVFFLLRRR